MSALTIYVAGGSEERGSIAGYLVQLRAAGYLVTYDWTTDPGWTDPTHPRLTSAMSDVAGIAAARVFPTLADRTFTEHGEALEYLLDLAQNEYAAARVEVR